RILGVAREGAASQGSGRDRRLLDDVIGLLEALGMTNWNEYMDEYWRVVGNDKAVKAYKGLAQYFKDLRSHLIGKHGATRRIGDPTTSFADKSYIEFTPPEVAQFDSTLGVYLVFEH